MLVELIQNNIVKRLPPTQLASFMGEFNYIHSMTENLDNPPSDPSMALIRQIVTEYIIFPLGSSLIRKQWPDEDNIKSFLFYGPAGTGKTMMVRAISSETKAVVYDLSPLNIQDVYNSSVKEAQKMVGMVMLCAKEYQPSIIYIDEIEKVWPAKKKKKKGQKRPKKDGSNPARIVKPLVEWKKKIHER